jgi:dolichol kinase
MRNEVLRKLFHLGSVVIPVGTILLGSELMVLLLSISAVLLVAIEVFRAASPRLRHLFNRGFGFMMRHREMHSGTQGGVVLTGSSWMLLAYAPLLWLFPVEVVIAAFLMVSLCDPAAALVGRSIGRYRMRSGKSLEGSLAFLLAGIAAAAITGAIQPGFSIWIGIAGASAATLAEAFPGPFDDNFIVPVAACVAMQGVASLASVTAS